MLTYINKFVILNLIQLILTTNSSSSYIGKQNGKIREISFFQILNDQNQTNKLLQSTLKSNDNYQEIVFNATDNFSHYNNKNIINYSNATNDSFNLYNNNSNANNISNKNITNIFDHSEPSSSPSLSSTSSLSSISYSSNDFYFKLNASVYDEYSDYQILNDEKLEYLFDRENTTKNTISIYSILNLHFENFLKTKKNKLVDFFRTIKQSGI
jgi:hypothetical protein